MSKPLMNGGNLGATINVSVIPPDESQAFMSRDEQAALFG